MSAVAGERTFPSPFAIETPTGAEGWEELYLTLRPVFTRF